MSDHAAASDPSSDPADPVEAPAPRPPSASRPTSLFGNRDPLFDPVEPGARAPEAAPIHAPPAPPNGPASGPAHLNVLPPPPAPIPNKLAKVERLDSEPHREIAEERGWLFIDLDDPAFTVDAAAADLMKAQTARQFHAIPVSIQPGRNVVLVAVENPDHPEQGDKLRRLVPGYTVRLGYANPNAIRRYIEKTYSASGEAASLARIEESRRRALAGASEDGGDLGRIQAAQESTTSQMLRLTIEQALRENASDIHFEPTEHELIVRIRVDNELVLINRYPKSMTNNLMTKIKIDSPGMHSDNFLVPDSGVMRYTPKDGTKVVDIRVEVAPTAWGPGAVMRLQQNVWRELSGIGFSAHNEPRIRRALAQPDGVILATGPTGSGKSTLMYSLVRERISEKTKIITLENPIEFKVPELVEQIPVNIAQGLDFNDGLRSILRRDPNVVLVGEIRDQRTAETAIDASMTGHLVLSTLHTNDAPGVVPRLLRMGIEPFLLSSALLAVVGQRLVKKLCPSCRVGRKIGLDEIVELGFNPDLVVSHVFDNNPDGCERCREGWIGRLPVHEVMLVGEDLVDAITDNAPQSVIRQLAHDAGMTTMREDGWEKVRQGITSVAEVTGSTRAKLV